MSLYGQMRDGSKVTPDDLKHRLKVIDALKQIKNWNLYSNEYKYMIDLVFTDHELYSGLEIEEGQWEGNFWDVFGYSNFLRDGYPKIEHKTVNIPPRKLHFWINGPHYYTKGRFIDEYWYTETNAERNVFVRTNLDVTQLIIVYPDVILNDRKVVRSLKKSKNITTGYPELWTGIKPEDCETFNYNPETKLFEPYIYKEKKLVPITEEQRKEKMKEAYSRKNNIQLT